MYVVIPKMFHIKRLTMIDEGYKMKMVPKMRKLTSPKNLTEQVSSYNEWKNRFRKKITTFSSHADY